MGGTYNYYFGIYVGGWAEELIIKWIAIKTLINYRSFWVYSVNLMTLVMQDSRGKFNVLE